jgi:hypothetical protein
MPALRFALLFLAAAVLCHAPVARAENGTTLRASHRHTLGERQTLAEARRLCANGARSKLARRAGELLAAEAQFDELTITPGEVRTYAAGLLRMEETGSSLETDGNVPVLVCRVRADVEVMRLARGVARAAADPTYAGELETLASQRLGQSAWKKPESQAAERSATKRSRSEAENESARVTRLVEPGMPVDELERLLGQPRTSFSQGGAVCQYRGGFWVVLRRGVVDCLRRTLPRNESCHCRGLSTSVIKR